MSLLTRRQIVASAGASMALALSPSLSIAQTAARLRCFWWGNPDRDKRTKALLETYSKKSGTQVAAESLGWGDYWTKLATQTAGGNAPDLIQMDYRYLLVQAVGQSLIKRGDTVHVRLNPASCHVFAEDGRALAQQ